MNDIQNKPAETGSSSTENTAEVIFGDSKYTIQRLKAGSFYRALKVYMDMIKDVAPKSPVPDKSEVTVDFDTILVSMFQTWPDKMIDFITICVETAGGETKLTKDKIKEDAYPEQITVAFRTCLQLNKVAENLKNFAAPIGELGAAVQPNKKG
jgi:hypothetical protein